MALKGILLVLSRSKDPNRQADFKAWYDGVHIPHVLETQPPGLTAATRFENLAAKSGEPASAAIYEMSDDPAKVFDEMVKRMDKRRAEGSTYRIDCLDVMKLQLSRKIWP
jgi:hypothetical protein